MTSGLSELISNAYCNTRTYSKLPRSPKHAQQPASTGKPYVKKRKKEKKVHLSTPAIHASKTPDDQTHEYLQPTNQNQPTKPITPILNRTKANKSNATNSQFPSPISDAPMKYSTSTRIERWCMYILLFSID